MRPVAASSPVWHRPGLILLACAIVAVLVQSLLIPIDGDVSWLITVSERVLRGGVLYRDIFEVNPPASVWLYLPLVWLAQAIGARPEAVVVAATVIGALVSGTATLRLAASLQVPPPAPVMAAVLGALTLLLPGGLFAQREHVAALLELPVLAALALVAERRALSTGASLALGVAAGLVIVIKPHFALALLPAAGWAAWQARGLRGLFPGALAAGAVLAAYAAAVLLLARDYLDYLPLLAEAYIPLREAWPALLIGPGVFVPVAVLVLTLLLRPSRTPPLAIVMLLGMAGFAVAALIQGKGYANHALPGTILGFAGLAALVTTGGADRARRRRHGAGALLIALTQVAAHANIQPPSGLVATLRQVAPPHPRMITLGTQLVTGHPVVRLIDGRWIGSRGALFVAGGVQYRRERPLSSKTRAKLDDWYADDLRSFATDVATHRPDVVLVERATKPWLFREPVIPAAMRRYRPVAHASGIEVWRRR